LQTWLQEFQVGNGLGGEGGGRLRMDKPPKTPNANSKRAMHQKQVAERKRRGKKGEERGGKEKEGMKTEERRMERCKLHRGRGHQRGVFG